MVVGGSGDGRCWVGETAVGVVGDGVLVKTAVGWLVGGMGGVERQPMLRHNKKR